MPETFHAWFPAGSVKSLSLPLNRGMQEKTSGIQAFVKIGSPVFSLTSSSKIFRSRGYPFAGSYSVEEATFEQTVEAFQMSYLILSLTATRIFKMGNNFILPHIRSFDSSPKDIILAQHTKLSHKPADKCTPIWWSCLLSFWVCLASNNTFSATVSCAVLRKWF